MLILIGLGCQPRGQTSSAPSRTAPPPCECDCDCPEGTAASPATSTSVGQPADVSVIMRRATKAARKRDGTACLGHLDRIDELDPALGQTLLHMRGQCLMMADRCEEGQRVARTAFEQGSWVELDAESLDAMIENYAALYCTGKVDDRTAVLRALTALQQAAYQAAKTPQFCAAQENTVRRRGAKLRPKSSTDQRIRDLDGQLFALAPVCYARAGDCKAAYAAYKRLMPRDAAQAYRRVAAAQREELMRDGFESFVRRCAAP